MPAMPRQKGKAKKIAYNILGIPSNIASKRNKSQRKINERLIFDETSRVR